MHPLFFATVYALVCVSMAVYVIVRYYKWFSAAIWFYALITLGSAIVFTWGTHSIFGYGWANVDAAYDPSMAHNVHHGAFIMYGVFFISVLALALGTRWEAIREKAYSTSTPRSV